MSLKIDKYGKDISLKRTKSKWCSFNYYKRTIQIIFEVLYLKTTYKDLS
jgi:hypothetical protein